MSQISNDASLNETVNNQSEFSINTSRVEEEKHFPADSNNKSSLSNQEEIKNDSVSDEKSKTEEPNIVAQESVLVEKAPEFVTISASEVVPQKEQVAEAQNVFEVNNRSRSASRERSESAVKELPLSGDRHRLSRSKSPKSRWHKTNKDSVTSASSSCTNIIDDSESKTSLSSSAVNLVSNNQEEAKSDEKPQQENVAATASSDLNTSLNTSQTAENDVPKVQRKRKWLSNDAAAANLLASKKSLTISTDTLKSYLPTNPLENSSQKDDTENADNETNNLNNFTNETNQDKPQSNENESNDQESIKNVVNKSLETNSNAINNNNNNHNNSNTRKVIEDSTSQELNSNTNSKSEQHVQLNMQTSRTVIIEVIFYFN